MRSHAAARRQNAFGRMHAVNVFRRGFNAHENDFLAIGLQLLRLVRTENDFAAGRARRGWQAARQHLALGFGIDGGVQQLVERHRVNPRHGLALRDQAILRHFHRDADAGFGSALAVAGLQHP